MSHSYNFQISNTPATLTRLIDAIRPERYDEKLGEDRFTLKEVIAHLADWEQVFLDRITLAVEYPGSAIEAYDEDARAIEHKYSEKDIHHELEVFAARRLDTVDYLLRLAEDDWDNTVIHPERGEQSVQNLVEMITGHDLYHIYQVTQYLS
ncbi:MAG TPA: DinB family protein [Fimbriimonas sp.]|nr:DinB family protein [Fimbriimonas sp.]